MSVKKTEKSKETKLKLSDFFFKEKHEDGTRMQIPLLDGAPSGEWLNILGPESDEGIKCGRAFVLAHRAISEKYKDMREAASESGDWTEYNINTAEEAHNLQIDFALNIVSGWSFTEEFSKESLGLLLDQYRALPEMISAHHRKTAELLSEK